MNLSIFAQYYNHPMMGYDGWGWGFMMLFWAALLIIGTILAIRFLRNDNPTTRESLDPIDIIKERYAKGDITKEQFTQMKRDLLGK